MSAYGDQPRASTHAAGIGGREPGAEVPWPPCDCADRPLDADAVRFLDAEAVAVILDARRAACLHRCPGWPRRRGEPPEGRPGE